MGGNWRPISDDVRGNSRRLTEELRAIKDRSGLSLTQIGARTHYSKASWERWFNGKRLITEQALESLAVAVDENARLLKPLLEQALREAESDAPIDAEEPEPELEPAPTAPQAASPTGDEAAPEPVRAVVSAPADPAVVTARKPVPARAAGWRRHLRTALVSASSALIGAAVGTYLIAPDASGAHSPAASSTLAPCTGSGCSGKDPQSTGCVKDDRTLITGHVGTIIIYLHYSARCRAAWGALTNAEPTDFATIITTTGEKQQALVHWGYDNYSMMVDASDPTIGLKVCGTAGAHLGVAVCTPEFNAPTS